MAESELTRLALLESNQKTMSNEISEIKKIVESFDAKLDKALEKKANVWVEDAMKYIIYATAGIIITAIMYLVIKH